jgi:hypothetical protein
MPNKAPRRIPYGQVAPHHVAHILGACTATIWAMAGALGDTIPVLSHGQNIAQAQHSHHARTTSTTVPITAPKRNLVRVCVEWVFGPKTRKSPQEAP